MKFNKLFHSPPLFNLKAVSILHDSRNTEVEVGHPPVEKVEDVCTGLAVELGFDALRVCVRGQLLAGVFCDQKQCVVLRVSDFELVCAEGADLLRGGIRVDEQGFGRAAYAHFLKGYTEIVCLDVQGGLRSGVIPGSRPLSALSAEQCVADATGTECSWPRRSAPGRPAPPGSS